MKKTHITLVGGQPAPVYIGIKYSLPDKVIYLCSEQTIDDAHRVQEEFDIPAEFFILPPIDLNQIEKEIEKLSRLVQNDQVTVNISGGTKPWTYHLTKTFSSRSDSSIFYVDQNNDVWDFSTKVCKHIEFDMDTLFRLYGNTPRGYKSLSDYTEEDFKAIKQIREIRKFNNKEFNLLTQKFSRKTNPVDTTNGSLVWDKDNNQIEMRLYNNKGIFKSLKLTSPHCRDLFINSGWFELEVAQIIGQWKKAKEVRLNSLFPTKNNNPKNEIDLIVDTGIKLLFIECKTQIHNETDLDKFRSAVINYGGLGSKALFITDESLKSTAVEKCKDNKIQSFSLKEYGGSSQCRQALFRMLEKELLNINPK